MTRLQQFSDIHNATLPFVWSGAGPIPAVGDTVMVMLNALGEGVVKWYEIHDGGEDNYLAVRVKFKAPPAWYVRQNGAHRLGCIFGAEIDFD